MSRQGSWRQPPQRSLFDELVRAVKRNRTSDDAIASGEAFLNMPRLKLVDVDGNILARALALMRKYQLDPRDSIHAASALTEGGGSDHLDRQAF